MAAVPWVDSTEFDSPIRELARRIGSATLDDGQIDDALGLVIAGDSGARPPTREWQAKYGLLCDTLMLSVRRDDPRLLRLLEIPPAIELVALMGGERGAHALKEAARAEKADERAKAERQRKYQQMGGKPGADGGGKKRKQHGEQRGDD
jgi:hypothetical protein